MSAERLFLADAHNPLHRELYEKFEKSNKIDLSDNGISKYLLKISNSFTKDEYKIMKQTSNEITVTLFIERDSVINDSCQIRAERDRKICTIEFAPIISNKPKRKLINLATDYALNTLGMEEACVILPSNNMKMINMLEKYGYENLGEEDGKIIYIKDKEQEAVYGYQRIAA